jgi:hypothetical protein
MTDTATGTSNANNSTRAMRTTLRSAERARYYRQHSRLAQRAAQELGVRPGTIEQMIHGHTPIQERFWALVHVAMELGDQYVLDKLLSPAPPRGVAPAPRLTPSLLLTESEADAAEDVARDRYILDRRAKPDYLRCLGAELEVKRCVLRALEQAP